MGEDVAIDSESSWRTGSTWRWKPTSMAKLASIEGLIFSKLKSTIEKFYVKLPQSEHRIWTAVVNKEKPNLPVVMVHGMGGGIGLWVQNIDALAKNRPLYAFDLLGFGRSSRPRFSSSPQLCEMEFVESIEEWRQEMKLDRMILLGHSLGAYVVSSYALKYPERIEHLFLVDPWGFPDKPNSNSDRVRRIPIWIRAIATLVSPFNPLGVVRAAGPWGPGLIRRFRPDIQEMFSGMFDDTTILDYIYHCNAQEPSGETAFKTLSMKFGWAKKPMIHRIGDVKTEVPMTFIYGARSWMDKDCGNQVKYLRNDSHVEVHLIEGAGHHVYADRPLHFNEVVLKIFKEIDQKLDIRTSNPVNTDSEPEEERETMPLTQL